MMIKISLTRDRATTELHRTQRRHHVVIATIWTIGLVILLAGVLILTRCKIEDADRARSAPEPQTTQQPSRLTSAGIYIAANNATADVVEDKESGKEFLIVCGVAGTYTGYCVTTEIVPKKE